MSLWAEESQTNDLSGTDFYLSFAWHGQYKTVSAANGKLTCRVVVNVLTNNTTVSLSNERENFTIPLGTLNKGVQYVDIPLLYCFNQQAEAVANKGFHLVSDKPIQVYAGSSMTNSAEVTSVLPTHTLGTNYIVQTAEGHKVGTTTYVAWFVVVATEDATDISITPSVATTAHNAQQAWSIRLQQGQTYLVAAKATDALTGTLVRSNKPIAVFQGNQLAYIPQTGSQRTSPQHLFEQATPTTAWGTRYCITLPYGQRQVELRCNVLCDNTEIYMNGYKQAGQWMRGDVFAYTLLESQEFTYIEASAPISCCLYTSEYAVGGIGGQEVTKCNPSMVCLTPMEQHSSTITFTHFPLPGSTNHSSQTYANIIVPASSINKVLFDGTPIAASGFSIASQVDPTCAYHVLSPISNGIHTIECEDGIVAYLYHLSNASEQTYAYNIGGRLNTINDGIKSFFQPYDSTLQAAICDDSDYTFGDQVLNQAGTYQRTIKSAWGDTIITLTLSKGQSRQTHLYDTICWGETYTWDGRDYSTTDDHQYSYISSTGCDSTVTLHLTVNETYSDIHDTINLCYGETYTWEGETFNTSATSTKTLKTIHGCDSTVTLHIFIADRLMSEFSATICPTDTYLWDGRSYTTAGDYPWTYQSLVSGCDSLVTLHLTHLPSYRDINDTIIICDGETATWEGETLTEDTTITKNLLTTNDGCDSIVTMHIIVNPTYDITFSDTIVDGETYYWEGETYTTANYYTRHFNTINGCDSTVTLFLLTNILTAADIQIADHCADDQQLSITFTDATGWFDAIELVFDDKAIEQGFSNKTLALNASTTEIGIDIPRNILANTYSLQATLLFHSQTMYSQEVNFRLLYPTSVIERVWDDVLAVKTHDYNGGYDFTAFQWIEDGLTLDAETHSYLYRELTYPHTYCALLTDSRGVQLPTCPILIENTEQVSNAVSPTLTSPRSKIRVLRDDAETIDIYDISGQKIDSQILDANYQFLAPSTQGIYLIVINTPTSTSKQKIIVK